MAAINLKRTGIGLRVFAYHSVSDDQCAPMVVSTRAFRRQLEYLSRRFNIITFALFLEVT